MYPVSRLWLRLARAAAVGLCLAGGGTIVAEDVDYERDVKPLLAERCYACHGALKQESSLRLDTAAAARRGGDSGAGFEPGDAAASLILLRVTAADPDERMPPEGAPLTAEETARLRRWIDAGAAAPRDEQPQRDPRAHWAFQPPRQPAPPAVQDARWVRNPIDAFVLARLEREGIRPAPAADRVTLLRRLYLDLVGLLPAPAEVDAFLADGRPGAYERRVERLLASGAFGERWGRHWLDLARYADSNGYEDDRRRADAWRFRDWVINAYNQDLPFDRFTVEQLAGDLLPQAGYAQKVAAGFHRMTLSNEGGADSVAEEFRIIAVKDRVNTTGAVWLGLTVGCAQCHAHKYDPLDHREYYQLFAFFNSAQDVSIAAPRLPDRYTRQYQRQLERFNEHNQRAYAALEQYEREVLPARLSAWNETAGAADRQKVAELLAVAPAKRNLNDLLTLIGFLGAVDDGYAALADAARAAKESGNNRPQPPSTTAMTVAAKPRPSHVHRRGSFLDLGEPVAPATPAFLPPLEVRGQTADRLDLARWIVDPRHPLTARVTVNQVWGQLFQRPLVLTADDFGLNGAPPSHPQLLDWLAGEFVRRGWSRKALVRTIVTSATYRQSARQRPELAERDPLNRLLARQSRRRLEAECVRDAALDAAGLLDRQLGGPSFQPPLPAGLLQLDELRNEQLLPPSEGADGYRRGVYIHVQRMLMYPMLKTFDVADPNSSCTRRDRSTSPLQALTLLNDPVFVEAARGLGRRIVAQGEGTTRERIRFAFRLCLAREPDDAELATLDGLYLEQLELCQADPAAAAAVVGETPFPPGTGGAEAAAWIGLARTLLNLDEFITRE